MEPGKWKITMRRRESIVLTLFILLLMFGFIGLFQKSKFVIFLRGGGELILNPIQ